MPSLYVYYYLYIKGEKIMAKLKKIKRPPIAIELDKERHLKYTLYSFSLMEERYGDINVALEAMEKGSIKAIIFMLWIGLIHEDKELTEQSVGEIIDITDMEDIAQKMSEAMGSDTPVKDLDPNKQPVPTHK